MNDVQAKIGELESKGWTLAAIADELELTPNAVEKWKAGDRYPSNARATLVMLGLLIKQRRIPKRKRYVREGTSQ